MELSARQPSQMTARRPRRDFPLLLRDTHGNLKEMPPPEKFTPNPAFANMATDPTVPRLLGSIFVPTELPVENEVKVPTQQESTASNNLNDLSCFCQAEGSFLTESHLYCLYSVEIEQNDSAESGTIQLRLCLARLCLFSQTWEQVSDFDRHGLMIEIEEAKILSESLEYPKLQLVPLTWEEDRKLVLLLLPNRACLLELKPKSKPKISINSRNPEIQAQSEAGPTIMTSLTDLEVLSLQSTLRPGLVLPSESRVTFRCRTAVVDPGPTAQAVYLILESTTTILASAAAALTDNRESRLANDLEVRTELALIRLTFRRPNRYYTDYSTPLWKRLYPKFSGDYNPRTHQLLRGDFLALHRGCLYNGTNLKVQKIMLPSLTTKLQRVTGGFRKREGVIYRYDQKVLSYCCVPPTPEDPDARTDTVYMMISICALNYYDYYINQPRRQPVLRSSGKVVRNQLWALSLPRLVLRQVNDGPAGQWQPQPQRRLVTSPSVIGPLLMEECCHLVAAPDGGELWMVGADPLQFFPRKTPGTSKELAKVFSISLPLFRIPLQARGVPSLASLTLGSLLLRNPVKSLLTKVVEEEDEDFCGTWAQYFNRRRTRYGPVFKPERTLSYLRSFVRRTSCLKSFEKYLPEEEEEEEEEMEEIDWELEEGEIRDEEDWARMKMKGRKRKRSDEQDFPVVETKKEKVETGTVDVSSSDSAPTPSGSFVPKEDFHHLLGTDLVSLMTGSAEDDENEVEEEENLSVEANVHRALVRGLHREGYTTFTAINSAEDVQVAMALLMLSKRNEK